MVARNEPDFEEVNPREAVGADGSDEAAVTPSAALQALKDILESAPFRASKQGQRLLKYVVHNSLAGHENLLRERVIGTEVFGRAPDYDTANDPIVRARVAEVRKRLAQYYVSAGHEHLPVRIEIPPGSYRARFQAAPEPSDAPPGTALPQPPHEESETSAVATPPSFESLEADETASPVFRRIRLWLAIAAIVLVAASVAVYYRTASPSERALRAFWSPAFRNTRPVLIYTGTNVVYRLSPEFLSKYRESHHLANKGPEFVVDLGPNQTLGAKDLLSSSNAYVTTGDVSACAAIITMLVRRNKPYEMRYASDISPGDVRAAPTVLIGAFNNPWTLNVTDSLRYTFERGDSIQDRLDKKRAWTVHLNPDGSTTDDYAIVTRLLNSDTGQILITAAGIGQYGTQAASEFVSNQQRIAAFAAQAPANWLQKNLQIVLHVKVVQDTPATVEIAAIWYW